VSNRALSAGLTDKRRTRRYETRSRSAALLTTPSPEIVAQRGCAALSGALWPLAFIATIFVANWLIEVFHLVPVGFGLVAPAGVYAAGFAFTFRDLTQERFGKIVTAGCIVVGALLSTLVSPRFALASGVAFLLSELADFAIYTPLRERGWLRAVAASNLVGLIVDSALFLWLAFGSVAYLPGQVVGKLWVTAAAVLVLWALRRGHVLPRHA
jgi:uncharacterized PurR-regulated membrane protein YhhQ (DUF165 family)